MHKHLRRLEEVWVEPQIYLVTVCATQRQAVLATDAMAAQIVRGLRETSERTGWRVGRYVSMPDHVHFFCAPGTQQVSLSDFVGTWKCRTTRLAWRIGHKGRLWQREFFDHLLRNGESCGDKWSYVVANPVRTGLCERPEEWPYQGELVALEW
jgi:REP element-mobilizing transposase RayT